MAKLNEDECLVKTIKTHIDKETGKKHSPTDKNNVRKVSKERAEILISAGVCDLFETNKGE